MGFELDFEELPNSGIKSLYKFKSFDKDRYHIDLLNNFLWLSSRTELNDPFDCRVNLNYDLCTDEQIKQIMHSHLINSYPESIRNIIVEKQLLNRKNNPVYYKNFLEIGIDKKLGVFSLTADLNELMWARYSSGQTGFCLEFDAVKLYERLDEKFQSSNLRIFIFKVIYMDTLPEINPCLDTLDEKAKMFLVKTQAWIAENEWRIVCFDGSKKKEPIAKECIKNIYFGLNTSEENTKTSIEILKKSNPEIGMFKAMKRNANSEIEYRKVEP